MRIENQTQYETAALRSLLCAVHARMAKAEGRLKTWNQLTVMVVPARRAGTRGGWATYDGRRMKLRLGKDVMAHDLACLMEHELFHSYGYRHKEMAGATGRQRFDRWAKAPETYQWADAMFPEGMPVRAPVSKPVRDTRTVQTQRYQRVLGQIAAWTTRGKRAQTALRKLAARRRYYERVLAAATMEGRTQHVE